MIASRNEKRALGKREKFDQREVSGGWRKEGRAGLRGGGGGDEKGDQGEGGG